MSTWYDHENTADIVYSPDDAAECGRGWYAQRWSDNATTDLYDTKEALTEDLSNEEVCWEPENVTPLQYEVAS